MEIRKASRTQRHLRVAVTGPTGAGKTFTALRIAMSLLPPGGRLGVVDTENGSANVYAGAPNPDGGVFDFDVIDLSSEPGRYSPANYVRAWDALESAGYSIILTDSISHAWEGEGGVLYIVDREKDKGNEFGAWRKGTPEQRRFIDRMLNVKAHHLITMRSKIEYVLEDVRGKKVPRKVGLSPVQRDGVEYEFDVGFEVDQDHVLRVSKTRLSILDGLQLPNAGADVGRKLLAWYNEAPAVVAQTLLTEQTEPPPPRTVYVPQNFSQNSESGLRAAFYAKFGEWMPSITQKEGHSKEEVDAREAERDKAKAIILQRLAGVSRLRDIPPAKAASVEQLLRGMTIEDFKKRADRAVYGEVGK